MLYICLYIYLIRFIFVYIRGQNSETLRIINDTLIFISCSYAIIYHFMVFHVFHLFFVRE